MNSYITSVLNGSITLNDAILDLDEDIRNSFYVCSFEDFWLEVNDWYNTFGFQDKLTDKQRKDEYKYIYTNFLKYVFKNQDKILNKDNDYKKMYDYCINLRTKTQTIPESREKIVYNKMRNNWIDNLINKLLEMQELVKQYKEE